jgi:ribose 1,5-bisphosphokinase
MPDSKPIANLYYLVGPSGVGKDSLLEALHEDPEISGLHVARRYITRPARRGDDHHIEIDANEFDRRERDGDFLFAWPSHGFSYAVDASLLERLNGGEDVVVNGSRAYLHQALEILPSTIPVWMSVSEAILRRRLEQRGRDNAGEIEHRLQRSRDLELARDPAWPLIVNDGSVREACRQFESIREKYRLQ